MTDGINGLALIFLLFGFISFIIQKVYRRCNILFHSSIFVLLFFNFKNKVFIGNSVLFTGGLISLLTINSYNLEYLQSSD